MTERPSNGGWLAGRRGDWAGLLSWLAARPRGRWATARGRWAQTVLTAALLLAGLSAWALALVQPWTVRTMEHGVVTMTGVLDTEKIRSAASDVEKLLVEPAAVTKPVRRNPFVLGAAATGEPPADAYRRPSSVGSGGDAAATPDAILRTVRGLKLEVILTTAGGERWAVINGEKVREGDAIAGLEIVEIQEGRVRLQQGGVTCLLRMD